MKKKNWVMLPGGNVRQVVARCVLAPCVLGVVFVLETHPCGPPSERGHEVLELVKSVSKECGPLKPGTMPDLKDRIVSFSEQFEAYTPKRLSFCSAVAVRDVDGIGNYCALNSKGDWVVDKYDPDKAYMAGRYVLLIVADPDAVEVVDTIELVDVV